jgi:hypothetical protein
MPNKRFSVTIIYFLTVNDVRTMTDKTLYGDSKAGYSFLDDHDAVSIWADATTFIIDRESFIAVELSQ